MIDFFSALILIGAAPILGVAVSTFAVGFIWNVFGFRDHARLQEAAVCFLWLPLVVLITGIFWIKAFYLIAE